MSVMLRYSKVNECIEADSYSIFTVLSDTIRLHHHFQYKMEEKKAWKSTLTILSLKKISSTITEGEGRSYIIIIIIETRPKQNKNKKLLLDKIST